MDSTLHQLGELLLKALPTFLLVIFLNLYLKLVFFKPLEKVLHQRYEATEGAREIAEQSLQRASAKTAEYEATLLAARTEVYRAQEKVNKELQERGAAEIAAARDRASQAIKQAQAALAKDVEAAKAALAGDSERLADQIADSILRRQAA